MVVIGILSLVLSALSLLWAIVGFFKPTALFCALPEFHTRKHAVCFPLQASVVFFLIAGAAEGEGWFGWVLAGILAFLAIGYYANLRGLKQPEKTGSAQTSKKIENYSAIHSGRDGDDNAYDHPAPKSEWSPDWEDTLKSFLGREFSKDEEEAYRELFGGDNECRFNLRAFTSKAKGGAICLRVAPDDHYKPRYETLVGTGAVLSGENIPPALRVSALSMQDLRSLAAAMNLPKSRSKAVLAESVIAAGNSAIEAAWRSTGIDIDDLFLFDVEEVKRR